MVEVILNRHPFAHQLMRFIAYILTGGMIAQFFSCVSVYLLINDSQVAGMIAHLLIQYLSNYFLVCAFIALSLANILVRRGIASFKAIRMPALTLILVTAVTSFLLIPRMDYLRETALLDGMPVLLSSFAGYFVILNTLTFILLTAQIICSSLMAWRLSSPQLN